MGYRLGANVLYQELDGEAVLLQLETEQYHRLDAMGTQIVALLLEMPSEEAIRELATRYDVSEAVLRKDVAAFIEGMTKRGLLELA